MGSHGPEPPSNINTTNNKNDDEQEEEITVLVTGFGPFKTYTTNPSHLLALSLPPSIPLYPSQSLTSSTTQPQRKVKTTITLLPHPTPLPVSYAHTLTALAPLLRNTYAGVDYVLHIGMAGGRGYYAVERVARRDGYVMGDVDGRVPGGGSADAEGEGGNGRGPEVLGSTVVGEGVLGRWQDGVPDVDVRLSDDAGRYLCDFTYYTSLLEFWRRDREGERPVVFLHVPGGFAEEDILRGREVVVALIRALVGDGKRKGVKVAW